MSVWLGTEVTSMGFRSPAAKDCFLSEPQPQNTRKQRNLRYPRGWVVLHSTVSPLVNNPFKVWLPNVLEAIHGPVFFWVGLREETREDAVLTILRAKGSNGGILPPICLREVGQNKPDVKERVEGRAQNT